VTPPTYFQGVQDPQHSMIYAPDRNFVLVQVRQIRKFPQNLSILLRYPGHRNTHTHTSARTRTQIVSIALSPSLSDIKYLTSCAGGRQWLKWFCEAGGGAHLTKPGWSKPNTHSNPTNLALFRHKITLSRFSQGGRMLLQGDSNGSRGAEPPQPPSL